MTTNVPYYLQFGTKLKPAVGFVESFNYKNDFKLNQLLLACAIAWQFILAESIHIFHFSGILFRLRNFLRRESIYRHLTV